MISSLSSYSKSELRKKIRQQRRMLSPAFKNKAAHHLLKSLRKDSHFLASQHIAVYVTNDGEINTSIFIHDLKKRKKTLYLPVLHPLKKGYMQFLAWNKSTPMHKNKYGIKEPIFGKSRVIPARFLQLVCMPLVAFDQHGNRLGMGGGYYDRTLSFMHKDGNTPKLIGCAYELQHVDTLPYEPWDIPVSAIATEKKLHQFKQKTL